MSLVNRLIKQASSTPRPSELVIHSNQIGTLAEHIRATQPYLIEIELVLSRLAHGQIRLMGIPLRVIGRREVEDGG